MKEPESVAVSTPLPQDAIQASLLGMPAEIRNEIYDQVFNDVLDPKDLTFLLACRQVYIEAHQLAYDRAPMLIDFVEDFVTWCSAVPSPCEHIMLGQRYFCMDVPGIGMEKNLWLTGRYWSCSALDVLLHPLPRFLTITLPQPTYAGLICLLAAIRRAAESECMANQKKERIPPYKSVQVTVRVPETAKKLIFQMYKAYGTIQGELDDDERKWDVTRHFLDEGTMDREVTAVFSLRLTIKIIGD